MPHSSWFFGSLISLSLLFTGCSGPTLPPGVPEPNRTALGCAEGLTVDFQATTWAPGHYRFTVYLDGDTTVCEGDLPLGACDAGPSLRCSPSATFQLGESGCALPPAQQGFSGLTVSRGPRRLEVAVEGNGHVLAEQRFEPAYRTVHPNGEGYPPSCTQAHEAMKLP